jgi:hypothetical protein
MKKTCLEQVNFYISLSDMPYDEKLSEKDQIVKVVKNGFGTVTQHILLGSVLVTLLYLW